MSRAAATQGTMERSLHAPHRSGVRTVHCGVRVSHRRHRDAGTDPHKRRRAATNRLHVQVSVPSGTTRADRDDPAAPCTGKHRTVRNSPGLYTSAGRIEVFDKVRLSTSVSPPGLPLSLCVAVSSYAELPWCCRYSRISPVQPDSGYVNSSDTLPPRPSATALAMSLVIGPHA